MPRLELAPAVLDDLDRFLDHLTHHEAARAPERIAALVQALEVLTHSPEIGRPVGPGLRELVIGRGSAGYAALYRYAAPLETVFVLTLRAQREDGYKRD